MLQAERQWAIEDQLLAYLLERYPEGDDDMVDELRRINELGRRCGLIADILIHESCAYYWPSDTHVRELEDQWLAIEKGCVEPISSSWMDELADFIMKRILPDVDGRTTVLRELEGDSTCIAEFIDCLLSMASPVPGMPCDPSTITHEYITFHLSTDMEMFIAEEELCARVEEYMLTHSLPKHTLLDRIMARVATLTPEEIERHTHVYDSDDPIWNDEPLEVKRDSPDSARREMADH